MYAEYYNLTGLPFQLTPDSRFYFESSVHAKAMAHLTYGLNQAEGFIVITGDVGAGKTTLVEHLCSTLDPQQYVIARMLSTQTSADDTLRQVASGFGLKAEGLSKSELMNRFQDMLVANFNDGRRSLLVVDEAQNLTVPAIEELRMLSNFTVNHSPPLQSFLLGQPQFRGIMALPGAGAAAAARPGLVPPWAAHRIRYPRLYRASAEPGWLAARSALHRRGLLADLP